MIDVLTTEASGTAGWSGGQASSERDVYLAITHTFIPDALRRQEQAEAWLAVTQNIDAELPPLCALMAIAVGVAADSTLCWASHAAALDPAAGLRFER